MTGLNTLGTWCYPLCLVSLEKCLLPQLSLSLAPLYRCLAALLFSMLSEHTLLLCSCLCCLLCPSVFSFLVYFIVLLGGCTGDTLEVKITLFHLYTQLGIKSGGWTLLSFSILKTVLKAWASLSSSFPCCHQTQRYFNPWSFPWNPFFSPGARQGIVPGVPYFTWVHLDWVLSVYSGDYSRAPSIQKFMCLQPRTYSYFMAIFCC